MKDVRPSSCTDYEIKVRGVLDGDWAEWFDGMAIKLEAGGGDAAITTLTGPVADQAALRGMLSALWDVNLTVISVKRMEEEA